MTKKRLLVGAGVLLAVAVTGLGMLYALGVFAPVTDYRPVPPGHQEIVFLAPATSGDSWERLVAAVDALHDESLKADAGKPRLNVAKQRAFTDLTADVPEVALWLDGFEDAKLWIRWCKLSSEHNSEKWIASLSQRPTPPLAVIGGDTSLRALRVAEALERHRGGWQGLPPLLFITTATADRYVPNNTPNVSTTDEKWPRLLDVYKGRSFRFSFTNARMAAAVLDFVRSHDELWPSAPGTDAARLASNLSDVVAASSNPLNAAVLAGVDDDLLTAYLYTLRWDDDSFSADLADRFDVVFQEKFARGRVSLYPIAYSVGDFYQPNPREAFVVGQIIPELKASRDRRQLMLLPADAERARRFLRTVVRRAAPQDIKNLVVMTGDSVGFNTIYRDRNVAWNIQDLPVPLVTFSHRNPVSEDVGFKGGSAAGSTGTEDLLLYRDVLETLVLTAYQGQRLTDSSNDLATGLHGLAWANGRVRVLPAGEKGTLLFNPHDGNRNDGTGEHIIVLRPDQDERGLLAQATITVWQLEGNPNLRDGWREVRTLTVTYDGLTSEPPGL